jgi:23S rRNA pseudouridine1911/1915/1917 synthase
LKTSPKIIYEDENILVIDKPSGLLTHPKNKDDQSESVVSWLLKNRPEIKNIGEDKIRPGIVHRLDQETSGLLLIAKNQKSFEYLKKLFQERKIEKTYLALVHGILKRKSGVIETPLGKLGARQTTRIHGKHELKEKNAITEYKVLREYGLPQEVFNKPPYGGLLNNYSLLEVTPKTGRTHQIRIHLKSIGHPVACDPLYAGKRLVCPPELNRLFLHAQRLSFVTSGGQALTVESEMPPELEGFLKNIAQK